MAFSYEPHTADVKIVASAKLLDHAFSEAARALTHVMTEDKIADKHSYPIIVQAESKEALLFDFLDELITLLDTQSVFVHHADITIEQADNEWRLSGHIHGDEVQNYESHGDVKAPTYHDLSVEQEEDLWVLRATLDI